MVKNFWALLSLCFLAAVIGCGGSDETTSDETSGDAATTEPAETDDAE